MTTFSTPAILKTAKTEIKVLVKVTQILANFNQKNKNIIYFTPKIGSKKMKTSKILSMFKFFSVVSSNFLFLWAEIWNSKLLSLVSLVGVKVKCSLE